MIHSRNYQLDIINKVADSFRAGHRAPSVQSPTGSGKGSIIAHTAASAAGKGKRALVLTHRREILLRPR